MKFRIFTKEGKHVTYNQLDIEACKLWGKQVNDEFYAFPVSEEELNKINGLSVIISNWFDRLETYLESSSNDWDSVIETFLKPFQNDKDLDINWLTTEFKPVAGYFNLFKNWKEKNYIIKKYD